MVDYINNAIGTAQIGAMPTPSSGWVEADVNEPAECFLWISPNSEPKNIILNIFSRKFRANSKSITVNSGGGSTSGGGQAHSHWCPAHFHELNTDNTVHAHQVRIDSGTSGNVVYFDGSNFRASNGTGGGPSTYSIGLPAFTTTESGGGQSSENEATHVHSTPNHVHVSTLVYGLYIFPYLASVTMHLQNPTASAVSIFGKQGDVNNTFSVTGLSLLNLYSPSGGPNKLGPGEIGRAHV